jgi:hypothetical protein
MYSFRLRLSNVAMLVAGIAALLASNTQARCDLIPTANGSVVSTGSSTSLTGSTALNISAGTVNASSGLYDANSVLYLANTNPTTSQTVTAQYTINGTATGHVFTVTLPANGVTTANQTVALPQQLNLTPGNNTVGVRVINSTGGSGVSVTGSSVAVTGYVSNGGNNTATGPGSATLGTAFPGGGGSVTGLTVNVPANANAQGLYSLNTSLTLNNLLGANQTVTAQYTVGGVATGSVFTVTLPGNGTQVLTLPTQLSGLGTGSHQIGITLGGAAGSVSVAAGSSLYATSYNATGGVNSATGVTAANQLIGFQPIIGGGTLQDVALVTVPVTPNTPTFWDANGSISILNNIGTAAAIAAQFAINEVGVGPLYDITLPANGVSTFSLPTQFASLTPGSKLSLQLSSVGFATANINIESSTLSLISHNQNPAASTPEPASMSLAAMAAMAFGAAAYRRRKQGRLEV